MKLHGTIDTEIDVSEFTILRAAAKILKHGYYNIYGSDGYIKVLEPEEEVNDSDKRGLFKVEDISYHGSPTWEYTLLTDDENVINDFLLAREIEKVIDRETE